MDTIVAFLMFGGMLGMRRDKILRRPDGRIAVFCYFCNVNDDLTNKIQKDDGRKCNAKN